MILNRYGNLAYYSSPFLRTELAEQKVIAQNNQQTVDLLSRLQPTPIPSYIVSSPYTSIYPPATTTATNG